MWKEIPAFSFSAGERKIMAHFVIRKSLVEWCIPEQPSPDEFA